MNLATPTALLSFRGAASAHFEKFRALGRSDPSQPGTKSWAGSQWDGDHLQTFEASCYSSDTSHRFLPTWNEKYLDYM